MDAIYFQIYVKMHEHLYLSFLSTGYIEKKECIISAMVKNKCD